MSFDNLVKAFMDRGYKVMINDGTGYRFALIKDGLDRRFADHHTNIRAGFCTPSENVNLYLNGKVAVDREDCFDKWSKCPICLPLPKNEQQTRYLFEQINWLLTNEYDFKKWVAEYPKLR